MNNEISHRCQQLLDHNKNHSHEVVSIRKRIKSEGCDKTLGYDKWSLYNRIENWDSDTTYMNRVCRINVCPFCREVMDNERSE